MYQLMYFFGTESSRIVNNFFYQNLNKKINSTFNLGYLKSSFLKNEDVGKCRESTTDRAQEPQRIQYRLVVRVLTALRPKEMRGRTIYQNPGENGVEDAAFRATVIFNQRKPHKEEPVE